MRPTPWLLAEPFRVHVPLYESRYNDPYGMFIFPRKGIRLRCIVSAGWVSQQEMGDDHAWDHVSVSIKNRCPTWDEMSFIKNVFFTPEETVIQFHPPTAEHINVHPYTLHLWRSLLQPIPLPPGIMV